jgi:hypothetical protein
LAADQQQSHDQNQAAPIFCPICHGHILTPDGTWMKHGFFEVEGANDYAHRGCYKTAICSGGL